MRYEVPIPALLDHQEPARRYPYRFKLANWGRRTGKTVMSLHTAVLGHGAAPEEAQPHRGLVDGLDVVWLAPDYPQATIIWTTEIRPRFRGAAGVRLNESEHTVTLPNGATLWLRSAEAIEGVRGIGKRLGGVIGDEAAHFDLEPALKDVILPALLDNRGWLLLNSTPRAGSYFNRLCEEVLRGGRSEEWAYFHATPFDNPTLAAADIQVLIDEYPRESEELKQEVYAELLQGGAILAFPNWSPDVHLAPPTLQPPPHWAWVAGLDWGITAPSVLLLAAVDAERRCLVAREWVWKGKDAYEAGGDVATAFLADDRMPGWPSAIWADAAMAAKTGIGGTTLLAEFQLGIDDVLRGTGAPMLPVLPAPKGPGSRAAGYNAIRKALDWGPRLADGTLPASRWPQLRIRRDACPYLARVLPVIRMDEKKQDQLDTGDPDDHPVDALIYLLAGAWPRPRAPQRDIPPDTHPGYIPGTMQRRNRHRTPEVEAEEDQIALVAAARQQGMELHGAYGPRVRR